MKRRVASWLIAITLVSCVSGSVAHAQAQNGNSIVITSPTDLQLFTWSPYSGSVTVNRHSDHSVAVYTGGASANISIYIRHQNTNAYGGGTIFATGGGSFNDIDADGGFVTVDIELDSSKIFSGFSLYSHQETFYATTIFSASWGSSGSWTNQTTASRTYKLDYQW